MKVGTSWISRKRGEILEKGGGGGWSRKGGYDPPYQLCSPPPPLKFSSPKKNSIFCSGPPNYFGLKFLASPQCCYHLLFLYLAILKLDFVCSVRIRAYQGTEWMIKIINRLWSFIIKPKNMLSSVEYFLLFKIKFAVIYNVLIILI